MTGMETQCESCGSGLMYATNEDRIDFGPEDASHTDANRARYCALDIPLWSDVKKSLKPWASVGWTEYMGPEETSEST